MNRLTLLCVAVLLVPAQSFAQSGRSQDPDWPCQQIKVPELSLASVWSGPEVKSDDTGWRDNPAVTQAVQQLAPRRVPTEQANAVIRDFAQQAGDQKQAQLMQLLVGLFSVLNQERSSVLLGLDRFGGRQKQLALEIRADNEQLRAQQADATSDPKLIQQMTQKLLWESEVFQDRRQAIRYACEVPSKIEQRLFALAHQIQQEVVSH